MFVGPGLHHRVHLLLCLTHVSVPRPSLPGFIHPQVIVQKEQASKSYSLSAYYLSKFFSELPVNLLGPLIFSTLVFWLTGLNHDTER